MVFYWLVLVLGFDEEALLALAPQLSCKRIPDGVVFSGLVRAGEEFEFSQHFGYTALVSRFIDPADEACSLALDSL